jgi:two-component system NarL family sensor kinase
MGTGTAAEATWLTLAEGTARLTASKGAVSPRRIAVQIGVIALIMLSLVAISGVLVSRRVAQQQAVHDVAELTDVLAASVLQPALTDEMATDPAAALAGLDAVVRSRILGSSLVHVKLWSPMGSVLYSDEPGLRGLSFDLEGEARDALTTPQTQAGISDLSRPENRFERGEGRLLEVYRPVWTPQGLPLLFETYFRYDMVSERSSQLWHGFAGVMLTSILVLFLLLLPLVWALLRRTRQAQSDREALLHHAVDASTQERARIAASLHDGIVQQLAGTSFEIAARAERARSAGAIGYAVEFGEAADAVRSSIAGLRTLLVEIYPPSLTATGLPATVRDLAAAAEAGPGGMVTVRVDVDEQLAARMTPAVRDAVFRVTRECLRNAEKHADATTVWIRLHPQPGGSPDARLEIEDNGVGFDPSQPVEDPESGHLGLALIADAARAVGAQLSVLSQPGRGSTFRMDVVCV